MMDGVERLEGKVPSPQEVKKFPHRVGYRGLFRRLGYGAAAAMLSGALFDTGTPRVYGDSPPDQPPALVASLAPEANLSKEIVAPYNFAEAGPFIKEQREIVPGDGERTLYVDPQNPNFIIAGTWGYGILVTEDGGATWKQEIAHNDYNTPRDFDRLPDVRPILFSDHDINVRNQNGEWIQYTSSPFAAYIQSGRVLKDGSVIVVGIPGDMGGGISITKDLKNWQKARGAPEEGMYRVVEEDRETGKIYVGGWSEYDYNISHEQAPGMGLFVSDDGGRNFYEHPLSDQLVDKKGKVGINSIKVTHYRGHEIILIGSEGSIQRNGVPYFDYPTVHIIIDGALVDQKRIHPDPSVTSNMLTVITPQRGIIVREAGDAYFSSYGTDIHRMNLDDVIEGRNISWQKITQANSGDKIFGAGHMVVSTDPTTGKDVLYVGGQLWKEPPNRFLPIRVAELP